MERALSPDGPLTQRQLLDGELDVLAMLEAYAKGDPAAWDAITRDGISLAVFNGMFFLLRDAFIELTPDSAMDWIGRKRAELLAEQAGA